MSQYTLSNKAEDDISGIYDYSVNTHDVKHAEAYLVALHEALVMLAGSPNAGTSAEDIIKNYLKFPVHKHRVFLQKIGGGIFVVRVLHQHMKYTLHIAD